MVSVGIRIKVRMMIRSWKTTNNRLIKHCELCPVAKVRKLIFRPRFWKMKHLNFQKKGLDT